jgi:hypothetical protein
MSTVSKIEDAVLNRFVERSAKAHPGMASLLGTCAFLETPTEEILEGLEKGKPVSMHARMARGRKIRPGGIARLEENYLYSTRRFPTAANNTIGSGALAAGTYPLFTAARGGLGDVLGFPTGFQLSTAETNMELPGQIPQGQSFVFNQMGISFNADATIGDTNQLLEAATLQYQRAGGQFTLDQGKISFWPGAFGQGGHYGSMTAAAGNNYGSNGRTDLRAVRNLRIARVLKGTDVFQYNFVIHRATKSTDGSAWALSNFVNATLWLWGGWKVNVPG